MQIKTLQFIYSHSKHLCLLCNTKGKMLKNLYWAFFPYSDSDDVCEAPEMTKST